MADLITRLILDNKNFDGNLAKSTKEVQQFQKQINNMKNNFSSALGGITKFIPQLAAIGSVAGVVKAGFDGINNSSQSFSDGLDIIKRKIGVTNDAFWGMVANGGSLSNFINKLGELKKVAEQTSIALDKLGSAEMFSAKQMEYWTAQAQAALSNGDATLASQYLKYATEAQSNVSDATAEAMVAKLNESMQKAAAGSIAQGLNVPKLTVDDIEKLMGVNERDLDAVGEQINRKIQSIFEKQTIIQGYGDSETVTTSFKKSAEERQKAMDELNAQFKNDPLGVLAYFRTISNDAEQTVSDVLSSYSKLSQQEAQLAKLGKRINGGDSSSKEDKQKALTKIQTPQMGTSIADLEDQLKRWNKVYENAGDEQGRLYAKKMMESIEKQIQSTKSPGLQKVSEENFSIEPLKKYSKELQGVKSSTDSMTTGFESASLLSSSMGDAFAATGEKGAVAFASVLKSIVPVIAAVGALAVAEGAEKGVSTSKNWIEAIAAVTTLVGTVIAAIASGKNSTKYANGGIVKGSMVGDLNTVQVNGGEMILNGSQQANLFRLLDSGFGNENQVQSGQVEFKIKGQELVGILKNYNAKTSRVL